MQLSHLRRHKERYMATTGTLVDGSTGTNTVEVDYKWNIMDFEYMKSLERYR